MSQLNALVARQPGAFLRCAAGRKELSNHRCSLLDERFLFPFSLQHHSKDVSSAKNFFYKTYYFIILTVYGFILIHIDRSIYFLCSMLHHSSGL